MRLSQLNRLGHSLRRSLGFRADRTLIHEVVPAVQMNETRPYLSQRVLDSSSQSWETSLELSVLSVVATAIPLPGKSPRSRH